MTTLEDEYKFTKLQEKEILINQIQSAIYLYTEEYGEEEAKELLGTLKTS